MKVNVEDTETYYRVQIPNSCEVTIFLNPEDVPVVSIKGHDDPLIVQVDGRVVVNQI